MEMNIPLTGLVPRVVGAALAFGIATAGTALAADTITMKLGYPTTADPQDQLARKYVAAIKERTNGRIVGQVYPTSQLGTIPRQVEGIVLGTQEVFMAPPGFLVGLNQAFQVTDAPGLFVNHDHAQRSLTDPAFREPYSKLAEDKGVINGDLWIYDGTSYGSTVPIKTLADLKGLKIRVLATPMERAVPEAFGATGVPIPFTEVVPALQQRVVDAARTSLVVMAGAKFYTVCKYLTVVNEGYIATGMWFSKAWLNKLPRDLRKILLDTSREMEQWASKNSESFVDAKLQEWRDNGATVYHFSPKETKEYFGRVRPLGDKLLGHHSNPEVRKFYAMLKESAKRNAPKTN